MVVCLALVLNVLALPQAASDDAAVRTTLNHYLQGHATGDPSHMRLAFLPTLVRGPTTFTGYFVLLKVDDGWRIANKVYVARPTR